MTTVAQIEQVVIVSDAEDRIVCRKRSAFPAPKLSGSPALVPALVSHSISPVFVSVLPPRISIAL